MVFDSHRNEVYARAIRSDVGPDSVVMDLGSGLGTLGLIAAQAGAARTYLIEPEAVLNIADEVARANELRPRIELVNARIEDVELPEPVDVIISVCTGNLLFSEDLLPSLFHARDRYLKPGGTMIPDVAELWAAPVRAPELHQRHVASWGESGAPIDMSSVRRFAANEIFLVDRESARQCTAVGTPERLVSLDLLTETSNNCDAHVHSQGTHNSECHGLLLWIRIRLHDSWLSSSPSDLPVHWRPVFLPIDQPIALGIGERISIRVHRKSGGDWSWVVQTSTAVRRHSTFLARADRISQLAKWSRERRPRLSDVGKRTLQAMTLFQAGASIGEVEAELTRAGMSPASAASIAREVATRYGAAYEVACGERA